MTWAGGQAGIGMSRLQLVCEHGEVLWQISGSFFLLWVSVSFAFEYLVHLLYDAVFLFLFLFSL
jgi:hypothetical protein